MHTHSRCFTVRPTAAPREAYSVLVIDRSVAEAEVMCAALREDGHVVHARSCADDVFRAISELKPQAVVIRMRPGNSGRAARNLVARAFPHLLLITVNAATTHEVAKRLPTRWTDLYELSAPPPPRMHGFPRALREAFEAELLCANF